MIGFLLRYWYALPVAGLLIAWWLASNSADHWKAQAKAERDAHEKTVLSYRAAADKAKALDLANVIRVQAERKASDEKVIHELENRNAVAADRYSRLLAKAEAYSRSFGGAGLPASVDAGCEAYAGTACKDIPALLKAAQDNTDQLIALQEAVREQGKITQ